MKILALSGSIRTDSSNSALLRAIRNLFHFSDEKWVTFEIKSLPFFDPELQFGSHIPGLVSVLRKHAT